MPVRLHKYLASCGVASRRHCEQLMAEGRVEVDGVVRREPGTQVDPDVQEIRCNGKVVKPSSLAYIALHKPPGHVCTSDDPLGRPRAIDLIPPHLGRLYTIGRLDADSEGLILLTNDGDFAQRLSHPRHHVHKVYELWLHEPLSDDDKKKWHRGIEDDGELLRVLDLKPLAREPAGFGYRVVLGEGRNRHLRRLSERSGKKVLRLKRVAIGPLSIGPLKRSAWRHLTPAEIASLTGSPESKPVQQKRVKPRPHR